MWVEITYKVICHALSHLNVRATPVASLLRPARSQWPLPGFQTMQPPAHGRWLGRNRGNPPELVAPAVARQCPGYPAATPFACAATADDLTRRLIKVIKHDQFPTFLRYNLPPIIRTSPDRASQHRQCLGIDTPAPPTESRPHRSSEAGALAVTQAKPPLFANLQSCHYARSLSCLPDLPAMRCLAASHPGTVPGCDSPF